MRQDTILLIILIMLSACGKKPENGYTCITRQMAVLTCRSDAALKYQNPTLIPSQEVLCNSIYPADVCYQSLYHESRI